MATDKENQQRLKDLGHDVVVDGVWGPQSRNATWEALKTSDPISKPPTVIMPPMPPVEQRLRGIVAHWAVSNYKSNAVSEEHYHYIVEGDGTVVKGDHAIEDNFSTADDDYAAHTKGFNTRVAGISCASMLGATSVTSYGNYPILEPQFESMCRKIAEIAKKYGVPVTDKTILSHAEVQPNLGIKQNGKWDISVLPYKGLNTAKSCGDYMRQRVNHYLTIV